MNGLVACGIVVVFFVAIIAILSKEVVLGSSKATGRSGVNKITRWNDSDKIGSQFESINKKFKDGINMNFSEYSDHE